MCGMCGMCGMYSEVHSNMLHNNSAILGEACDCSYVY